MKQELNRLPVAFFYFISKAHWIPMLPIFFFCTQRADQLTTSGGCPVDSKTSTMTVGPRGPVLLQDHVFLDDMAHFDRERIPERVVHAKGAG